MRGERDVVHEHDGRRLQTAAVPCSRARRTRPGCPVFAAAGSASCSHAVPGEPGMTRSSASRSGIGDRLVRVEHERVARRSGVSLDHARSSPDKMTADAGRFAAELAGVNADAHFGCGRSTARPRARGAMPPREQRVFVGASHVARRLSPCELPRAVEAAARAGSRADRRRRAGVPAPPPGFPDHPDRSTVPHRRRLRAARRGSRRRPARRQTSPRAPVCRILRRTTAARTPARP